MQDQRSRGMGASGDLGDTLDPFPSDEQISLQTDFDSYFQRRANRPFDTPDWEGLMRTARTQFEGSGITANEFARTIRRLSQDPHNTLKMDEDDIKRLIDQYVEGNRQKEHDRQQRKRAVRQFFQHAAVGTAIVLAVGGGVGTYFGARDASSTFMHDRKVAERVESLQAEKGKYDNKVRGLEKKAAELQQRETALEQRFFGPLPTLTQASSTTLSPLETQLYAGGATGVNIITELADRSHTIYDQEIGGVRIIAKAMPERSELLILRMTGETIIGAHTYASTGVRPSTPQEIPTQSTKPRVSVLFDGNSVKVVDHTTGIVSITGPDLMPSYRGSEGADTFRAYAETLRTEFGSAYSRGIAPQK